MLNYTCKKLVQPKKLPTVIFHKFLRIIEWVISVMHCVSLATADITRSAGTVGQFAGVWGLYVYYVFCCCRLLSEFFASIVTWGLVHYSTAVFSFYYLTNLWFMQVTAKDSKYKIFGDCWSDVFLPFALHFSVWNNWFFYHLVAVFKVCLFRKMINTYKLAYGGFEISTLKLASIH